MVEMRNQVYRRVGGDEQKHDMHMFNILMAFDGKRSVETIAREDHYEIDDLIQAIQQLVVSGAIEPADMASSGSMQSTAVASSDSMRDTFFSRLEDELNRIMGPVSGIILQENMGQLGADRSNFPMNQAGELVQLISRNIPDNKQSQAFIGRMTELLNG